MNPHDARLRRDEGIANARQGQLNFDPDWMEESLSILKAWAAGREPFLAEDFLAAGVILRPKEPRAMGALFVAAAKRGIVKKAGYAMAKKSNCCMKPTWVRA